MFLKIKYRKNNKHILNVMKLSDKDKQAVKVFKFIYSLNL